MLTTLVIKNLGLEVHSRPCQIFKIKLKANIFFLQQKNLKKKVNTVVKGGTCRKQKQWNNV